MEKGVTFIGTLIVDIIKMIDQYPDQGELCNMGEITHCVGGLAANTAIDLKVLSPELTVASMGMVGNDEQGLYLTEKLASYAIDTHEIATHPTLSTSFTDVMTVQSTGKRTFFQQQGACAAYGYDDIDFDTIKTTHAHVGYALLMNKFDSPDPKYGTGMARILHTLLKRGISTSIDLVSDAVGRYQSVVIPSLQYTDYLFMNELEAAGTTGIELTDSDGNVIFEKVAEACNALFSLGVRKQVILHAPVGGWAMEKGGSLHFVPSLPLKPEAIVGTVGAGDAFCAGMLHSIVTGLDIKEGLQIANLAAAANLTSSNSIDGIKPLHMLSDYMQDKCRKE